MRARLLCTLIVAAQMVLPNEARACHKKGHDCTTDLGTPDLRDLPFRVAKEKEFFKATYPDIVSITSDEERIGSILSGATLIAVASPLDVQAISRKNPELRLIAVLRTTPSLFLVSRRNPLAETTGEDLGWLRHKSIALSSSRLEKAYILAALSRAGLAPETVRLVEVSSPSERLDLVAAGKFDAAVVPASIAFESSKRGLRFRALSEYLGRGLDAGLVGLKSNLDAEHEGVARIIQGLKQATSWLYDPGNREAAISVIRRAYKLEPSAATFVSALKSQAFSSDLVPKPSLLKVTNEWLTPLGIQLRWKCAG